MLLEPLLEPTNRPALFPLDPKYKRVWKCYEDQRNAFWIPSEISLLDDKKQWLTLDDNTKFFLKHVLAFFAVSDGIVLQNLNERFILEIQIPEVNTAYTYQAMMENIHHEMYSLFINELVPNHDERLQLFDAINSMEIVGKKAKWAQKWISSDESYAVRLIAFACVEGIFFSGSFCAIDWLKSKNIMSGLCHANEFISRDEGQHTEFACILYELIENKLSESAIHDIIKEAVKIEQEFVRDAIPIKMIGMNADLMCEHIEHCANILANDLGCSIIYKNSKCPFSFMETRGLKIKSNFFEHDDTNYQKSSSSSAFTLDADF